MSVFVCVSVTKTRVAQIIATTLIDRPPPLKIAILRSATFVQFLTFSRGRAVCAVERNFRATLAIFVRFEGACTPTSASVGRAEVSGRVLRGGPPVVQSCGTNTVVT